VEVEKRFVEEALGTGLHVGVLMDD